MFVVGKGGVGRSTVTAALARRSQADGRRTLAIDATASGGLASALAWAPRPVAGRITVERVPPDGANRHGGPAGRLSLLELSTEAALEEYVRMNLKLPGVANLGPVARILDYVATAAPAVREILAIGKIGHEVRAGNWDQVVVDAPATGHVIELLAAPDALRPLVGRGPLAEDTVWLAALLADPTITTAVIVSLTEELVVNETQELASRMRSETPVGLGAVVANRVPAPVGPRGRAELRRLTRAGHPVAPVAALAVERYRDWGSQRRRLEALALPLVEVADDPDRPVGAVSDALSDVLSAARW